MSYQILDLNEIQDTAQPTGLGINTLQGQGLALQKVEYNNVKQVKANLITLFLTAKGERLYQPGFGTNIRQALFQPNTDRIKLILDPLIKDPIAYWMPYITVTTINITTAQEDPTLIHNVKVVINYIINGLNFGDYITIFSTENSVTGE